MNKSTTADRRAKARAKALNRLSRLEGQLRGVRRMIEQEDRCLDIITQVLAIKSAVSMLGVELIKEDLLCKRPAEADFEEALKKLFLLN